MDGLVALPRPTLQDWVDAASEYVVACEDMEPLELPDGEEVTVAGRKKAGQIRLSAGLGRALAADLHDAYAEINSTVGETQVSGALRVSQVDVVEMTQLDGLKLAIELKPVNLAVGRAIWNRYGDIRVSAVSMHLKYPFAVVGGVLTVPTWETTARGRKSTEDLIRRACDGLRRAGGRVREDDAPHRLEGVAVVAFDPDTASIREDLPSPYWGLRWDEAVESLARAYEQRFPPASSQPVEAGDEDE